MTASVTVNESRVPARRLDAAGAAHVDHRAILALALPLMANSGVQLLLNLTDLWFVGRISTEALAAVGAVHWLAIVAIMVLGGVGLAVQTLAAQAFGAGRMRRASQSAWTALWGTLFSLPLFVAVGFMGGWLLAPFRLDPEISALAEQFWLPRLAGAVFGAGVWAMLGFFNGISRPRVTLVVTAVMAVVNAIGNEIFIFRFGWGVAGSAIATTIAQALGLAVAVLVFLNPEYRARFRSHLTWKLHLGRLVSQVKLGFPMGLLWAADLIAISIFLLMMVRIGTAAGAASQVVMTLTAVAYMPGVGIAQAGTTLVGQSIGAGDKSWAYRLGNHSILLAACYMGGIGIVLAIAGPWLVPFFVSAGDTGAQEVARIGAVLLWVAAVYQFFDGLNLGSGFVLRGAGDVRVPAALVFALSWLVFLPLAHSFSFGEGQGWIEGVPQLGLGATGGWWALVIYVFLLGTTLLLRWRSQAWIRMSL